MVAGNATGGMQGRAGGAGIALSQQVLRTDASGMPLEWIDYKEAVRLHCLGQVAYAFGSRLYALHGGCAIAAALSGRAGGGKIVAVVSGGNIDLSRFAELVGAVPATR